MRNRAPLLISKKAASAPESERVLLPRPSSVISRSATLMAAVVSLFSGSVLTVLARLRAVGASLTSVSVRLKACETAGDPAMVKS